MARLGARRGGEVAHEHCDRLGCVGVGGGAGAWVYDDAVGDRLCCLDHELCCELCVWHCDLGSGVEVVGESGAGEVELVGEVVQ